jgi:hypothetical protein
MGSQEYVLMTGSDDQIPPALTESLAAALPVKQCPGPSSDLYCPAVHQEVCSLRRGAKAAVVYLAGEHEFHSPGRWECVMGGITPAVVVLEGLSGMRRSSPLFAIVGAKEGPLGVLEALAGMFDSPHPLSGRERVLTVRP